MRCTCKLRLEDEDKYDDTRHLTPGERIAMVWEITKTAWAFKEPGWREPRLQRDVGTLFRGRQ